MCHSGGPKYYKNNSLIAFAGKHISEWCVTPGELYPKKVRLLTFYLLISIVSY